MAKATAATADTKAAQASPKKGGGKLRFYTIMVCVGLMAPFMFPTVVLFTIGISPTIFAFFIDKDRQHSSATAIGAMNCAGVTPFIIDLWIRGHTMGTVFHILGESGTWLIILGSAAIGQLIVSVIPQAMATITLAHAEARVKTLKQNLELLQNSWGPDVGTTKPIDEIMGESKDSKPKR